MLDDLAAVTPEKIDALGLGIPDDLDGVSVPLWRSSPKAKFHWADERSSCQHMLGNRHWHEPSWNCRRLSAHATSAEVTA